uniref:Polysaccharide biosynthesis protein C-terminal domain-containing protein n=1 Tax=Alexandrium monilatum TaxID=311494 RepID=A0A7S4Q3N4_9DINO
MPRGDALDRQIVRIALPSVVNLLILPMVNAVDTYWVGRMGNALALAGQGAANQVFSSIFWVIAFLPSVTTPLVAEAVASGDKAEARRRICEAGFLAGTMGLVGAVILGFLTPVALRLVLAPGAPAEAYAQPYLRIRALSFVPALLSTVGFAAFRGFMDTVTPLRVVFFSNLLNVLLDPVLMFTVGLGMKGAAMATVLAEVVASVAYAFLLFRRQMITPRSLFRIPSPRRLAPLLQGGAAVQLRSLALNTAFVMATRRAQAMDSVGVSAAAYAISLQFWQLSGVALYALQGSASILVPAEKSREGGGAEAARAVADRLLLIGLVLGIAVACVQLCALPLLDAFSTLPSVRSAAVTPVLIASFMSVIAGVVFVGEGIMMGRGAWGALARLAAISCSTMVLGMHLTGSRWGLNGIWFSIISFNLVNLVGVLWHHFVTTPRKEKELAAAEAEGSAGGSESAV